VTRDRKARQVLRGHKVFKESLARRAKRGLKAHRGRKVLPVIRERRAIKEKRATRVTKAIRGRAIRATLDRKGKRAILVRQAVLSK
jgi:hypothetical protein